MSASCTFVGIIFAAAIFRESLPNMAKSPLRPSNLALRLFSPTHARSPSSMSNMSDTDTLVDPDSSDTQVKEGLLANMPQGVDSPGFGGSVKQGWGFWDLMARGPVQIMSVTMFLNQYVLPVVRNPS